ncbi:hypothetical protein B0I72DRAFT_140071 [Yarrowia lipolytica]|jgi:hypothetical protein|uniref:YALI0E32989p n=2 Tax=Yarrowia lipolytica TaxID=4952 RepID=Q6C3Q4_YARLI|nr:YALI0E32989p [Yarrowia lipolytica CLIB122]AOW06318.1 hypothetical protein YALI1_E39193g [Yarrowia lipolytica]KAB8285427.1 hypothetical protein BKA91DRAFT_133041 [Yarrowia lipolytica]KAE8175484.1 hypothetical protein BKA90DRAFT_132729 [Yarrowia lipolytica]KAJ8057689.1 hypothetical protein LXG23DRAFT_54386 [Yarrowia lipolytica]QNQ00890.1 Hypothetical protein YALI2_F00435g [Yarrowia lipolytica]|eukprot:XP_504708.1 YALI0E32989p [Yarrowia lipolytica CLIB122]
MSLYLLETKPPTEITLEDDGVQCKVDNVVFTFPMDDDVPFVPSSEPLQCYPLGGSAYVVLSSKDQVRRASVLFLDLKTSQIQWKSMKKVCPEFWSYGSHLAGVQDATSILDALKMVGDIQSKVKQVTEKQAFSASTESFGLNRLSLMGSIPPGFSDSTVVCSESFPRQSHLVILATNWPWISDKLPGFDDNRSDEKITIYIEAGSQAVDVLVDFIYGKPVKQMLNATIILELARFNSIPITINGKKHSNAHLPPGLWEECLQFEPIPQDFVRLWRIPYFKKRLESFFGQNRKAVMETDEVTYLSKEELLELLRL